MYKEELIELTNKLYKITLLFPKKEPLRYKIREKADNILADFVTLEVFHTLHQSSLRSDDAGHGFNPDKFLVEGKSGQKDLIFDLEKDFGIINSYFEVAKWQNWVNYFDVLEIQEKYDKIKCDFKKEIQGPEEEKSLKIEFPRGEQFSSANLDARKEKILEVLKEKGQVQVWEVKEVFPQVTKRTLRRDFEKLLKQGLIERIGERNETFYKLKKQEI